MEFQERFLEALRISGKTRTELAKEIGVSPVSIHNWLTGKIQGMRGTTATRFEQVTGIRASWLLTGKGSKLVADTDYEGVSPAAGMHTLPILAEQALLKWKEAPDPYAEGSRPDGWIWIMSAQASENAFAFRVRDMSMKPACLADDLVIVDPDVAVTPGAVIAAIVNGTSIVVRKYRARSLDEDGGETFELAPLNEDFPIIRSTSTPISILGAVVELRRSLIPA